MSVTGFPKWTVNLHERNVMDNLGALMGARIALIEDDRLLRSSLEMFLRVRGALVEAFECAKDAIPAISLSGFDAVISDFLLPGENGLNVLLRARQAWTSSSQSRFRRWTWEERSGTGEVQETPPRFSCFW